MLRAESVLSSTMRMRRGVSRATGGGGVGGGGAWRRIGRWTTNSLPWPRPALCASTLPPWSFTSRLTSVRPMPSPPLGSVERARRLHEEIEHPRQQLGIDASAVVAHADDDFGRLDVVVALSAQKDTAAVGTVFAGVA